MGFLNKNIHVFQCVNWHLLITEIFLIFQFISEKCVPWKLQMKFIILLNIMIFLKTPKKDKSNARRTMKNHLFH